MRGGVRGAVRQGGQLRIVRWSMTYQSVGGLGWGRWLSFVFWLGGLTCGHHLEDRQLLYPTEYHRKSEVKVSS